MIRSMTGYGRGEAQEEGILFEVEIRAVNHRYSDVSIRMPKQLTFLEDKVRSVISNYLYRGKIDVYISYENMADTHKNITVDDALAKAYIDVLQKLRDDYNLIDDITVSLVAKFPEVIKVESAQEDEEKIWNVLKRALETSLNALIQMRENEGLKLKNDLLIKKEIIKESLEVIKQRAPNVVHEYRQKLQSRISELLDQASVDETRIATEVALFADRCSIDEELVRLDSHLNQLTATLEMEEPVGRKLDFLIQEMIREANTIGSKANDLDIIKEVLKIKGEIEKMREQVQNIE
ncbi:MAG TPA: YicC family protein [Clostridiaceae bacterium]|nr:YicC family protein [Clostridiaceae bacterium]